ncbi:Glutathione transferase, theta class [Phytophthora palmivora]|uniref:Glutathione transferase, theta class n=1 Tax=Phytophthora palmivora TaxID=4796 RepID=A0A2P4Y5N9_9STRA|nr:Glutathione transferase, theta class [Phytophthora palmivora]
MAIKLYANLISQPSRAAEWVMRLKKLDHEFVVADFGTAIFKSPEFLALNPNGLIPVLQDGDFSLFEGNAIMPYLAEKFGWTDLYPTDVQAHAKVNQYLHWHHTNARLITPKVLVPLLHTKQNIATPEEAVFIKDTPALITKQVELMEKFLIKDFVAETDHPTIADIAAYCEFVQVELMGIYDFSKYPKFSAWLKRMKAVPHHDEIHEPLDQFLTSIGLKTKANHQPSRAVEWVMRLKKLEHELVLTEFGSHTFTSDEFLAWNPNGLIPVLLDGDFVLFESHAIMVYLAEKFEWTDLYPKDIHVRAKVNEYLHWHHTNARLITMKVLVPLKRIKLNKQLPDDIVLVKEAPTIIAKLVQLMEKFLVKDYIAETNELTIADVAAYCEFVQIELMGIFDFTEYSKFSAWMQRMKTVPMRDEIHATLDEFLSNLGLKTKAKAKEQI